MELNIMLGKESQVQKNNHIFSHMWNLDLKYIIQNTHTYINIIIIEGLWGVSKRGKKNDRW
jgi:hypothetical protein